MYLSIDIGGTYIKYAILSKNMDIIEKWQKPTKRCASAELFYDYICQDIDTNQVIGVGVSTPGIIAEDSRVLSKAADSICVMYGTNVNKEITARLNLPVSTLNDARAAGLCEVSIGNGRNSRTSAYWLIGTGIGGALFNGTEVIRGQDNFAGEFSHLPIGFDGKRLKGMASQVSIPGLLAIYKRNRGTGQVYTAEQICQDYLAGERIAKKTVDEWLLNIVKGLNIITIFYNPEIICIGGGISSEDWFIKELQKLYYQEITHAFSELVSTKIERCKYRNDANLIGAAISIASCISEDMSLDSK
ncbi:hypothetical protein BAU15_11820 [Enterococcus sp. JM4C]|uniref:ROK family protein n=1 Tax=Candidatus Enterococcus huntleyi TaxID=1857217 RepID=UPI00137AC211|nr:ROK family protein [Enterococcus sp. JM4C]KAF1298438.1 hypothetical protein BAU15_11820 [Enterococcus sp. JM4C]